MAQIDMPHSCEVTAARIDDAIERYADRLTDDEANALIAAEKALARIAREDRERMANETS